jgi:tetratricopeptide (TPR) repeat protein
MFDAMRRIEGGGLEKFDVVGVLISDINQQVRSLRDMGKKDDLQKLTKGMSSFLSEIALDYKKLDKLDIKAIVQLANAFEGLNDHASAAEMYNQFPRPKELSDPKAKITPDVEKLLSNYCYLQTQRARMLRLSNDLAAFKVAEDLLGDVRKQPNCRGIAGLLSERALLYETRGDSTKKEIDFVMAVNQWKQLMDDLKNNLQNADIQKIYFPAIAHRARNLAKYSNVVDPKGKNFAKLSPESARHSAANTILSLEFSRDQTGWSLAKDDCLKVLRDHAPVKKVYDQLRPEFEKKAKATPPGKTSRLETAPRVGNLDRELLARDLNPPWLAIESRVFAVRN